MTRLREEWIKNIQSGISAYEHELKRKTGMTLLELSAMSNDMDTSQIIKHTSDYNVAVIPVTTGEGIIGTFSQSVASIIRQLGFNAFVTERTDVDGIYEAYLKNASCLFLADDKRFLGINIGRNIISDNNAATAKGYITVLEHVCGGLAGKEVLLLGYGTVGKIMLELLINKDAIPIIYDKNEKLLAGLNEEMILKGSEYIKNYKLILDATNEGGWIQSDMIDENSFIAAPGIPLSLKEDDYEKHRDRVVNDWLQIGTAVMMGELCK